MGSLSLHATSDAAAAIERAGAYLAARPVELSVIWSVMSQRAATGAPGRYWLVEAAGEVAGLVIESPPGHAAAISPMPREHVAAIADAISEEGHRLFGVAGEALTASAFAGCWTERVRVAAVVTDAQRLYALGRLVPPQAVPGRLRRAEPSDRDLLIEWWSAFQAEIGTTAGEVAPAVDFSLGTGRVFLWEDGGPRCMARATQPLGSVSRIGVVFTPPAWRRRGYAGACVGALCEWVRDAEGAGAVLYAQLGNASSNAIYRRLGFEAVSEMLVYRFDEAV
ncbi:MAG: GNAT family N-acetyltransferase [Acidimicrobiales bacterium]|jgi:predicted GNAT family acetyltransferase